MLNSIVSKFEPGGIQSQFFFIEFPQIPDFMKIFTTCSVLERKFHWENPKLKSLNLSLNVISLKY